MNKLKKTIKSLISNRYLLYKGKAKDKVIALTFDDGPHKENTTEILKILREENVKATFFIIGKEAEKFPELIKQMAQDTHEVANHSYSHVTGCDNGEIEKTERIIKNILGHSSRIFRPPWGKITLKKMGYSILNNIKVVLWSFDSMDDRFHEPQELKEYIIKSEIAPGEILLFHEDYKHTKEALPDIIVDLKCRGFRFSTVSELLDGKL